MRIAITIYLDDVTPEADRPRFGTVREPILRLGVADLVFPFDPGQAASLALDMIECLGEIRSDALRRIDQRQAGWEASRQVPTAGAKWDVADHSELRGEPDRASS